MEHDPLAVACLTLDREGTVSDANRNAVRLLGVGRDSLLGRSFSSFLDVRSRETFVRYCREVAASGTWGTCELELARHDGSSVHVRLDGAAVAGAHHLVLTPLGSPALHSARPESGEWQELCRALIDNSTDGIALVREDRYVYVNRRVYDMFGYAGAKEVCDLTLYDTVHPDDREKTAAYAHARHAGRRPRGAFEFRGMRKDGSTVHIEASIAWVTYRGEDAMLMAFRDITKRKTAERSLREEEEKFRLLFEKSADPILLLDDDTYVDCNEAALKATRCPGKDRLIGLHPWDLAPQRQPDGRLSREKAEEMAEMTRRQGTNRFEWVRRAFNGEEFWIEVSHTVVPVQGKRITYSVWRDIQERKQAETRLRESEERYRIAIESSNDGVLLLRGEEVLYANRRFLDMLGCGQPGDVLGRKIGFAIHPDDRVRVLNYLRGRQDPGRVRSRYEFRGLRLDGTVIPVEATPSQVMYRGRPALLAYVRDITERRQAEKRQGLVSRILETLTPRRHLRIIDRILFLHKEHTA
jgi:PAS domain S-box-containing protein